MNDKRKELHKHIELKHSVQQQLRALITNRSHKLSFDNCKLSIVINEEDHLNQASTCSQDLEQRIQLLLKDSKVITTTLKKYGEQIFIAQCLVDCENTQYDLCFRFSLFQGLIKVVSMIIHGLDKPTVVEETIENLIELQDINIGRGRKCTCNDYNIQEFARQFQAVVQEGLDSRQEAKIKRKSRMQSRNIATENDWLLKHLFDANSNYSSFCQQCLRKHLKLSSKRLHRLRLVHAGIVK